MKAPPSDPQQNPEGVEAVQRDEVHHVTGELPSRRPELGPSPTEGDDFFRRLDEGGKQIYG